MKFFVIISMLLVFVSCDPYRFGFEKNPAFVLDETFKSITNLDQTSFLELTSKEALCVYGNDKGIKYLKENLQINSEEIRFVPNVLETRYFKVPNFVGYWSYYFERFEIDLNNKTSDEFLMRVIFDCNYGTEDEKDQDLINLKPSKYKKKECRIVKFKPKQFAELPIPEKCGILRLDLEYDL
jgi:hypothetical protein